MTRRRVYLTKSGNIVVARGWNVQPLLLEAGVKAVFSGSAQGWMFDVPRLPDVEALLASRNIPVEVVDDDARPKAINEMFPTYFEGLDYKTSKSIVEAAQRLAGSTEVTELDVRAARAEVSSVTDDPPRHLRIAEDGALW